MGLRNVKTSSPRCCAQGMDPGDARLRHRERHARHAAPARDHAGQLCGAGFAGPAHHRDRRRGAFRRETCPDGKRGPHEGRRHRQRHGRPALPREAGRARREHEITVFCEEPRPAYDRVQLTSFFSGKTAADLTLVPEQFFEKAGVTLRLNDAVLPSTRARSRALGALPRSALRQAGARHRLLSVRAAGGRGATGATASSTARSRTSR